MEIDDDLTATDLAMLRQLSGEEDEATAVPSSRESFCGGVWDPHSEFHADHEMIESVGNDTDDDFFDPVEFPLERLHMSNMLPITNISGVPLDHADARFVVNVYVLARRRLDLRVKHLAMIESFCCYLPTVKISTKQKSLYHAFCDYKNHYMTVMKDISTYFQKLRSHDGNEIKNLKVNPHLLIMSNNPIQMHEMMKSTSHIIPEVHMIAFSTAAFKVQLFFIHLTEALGYMKYGCILFLRYILICECIHMSNLLKCICENPTAKNVLQVRDMPLDIPSFYDQYVIDLESRILSSPKEIS